MSVTTGDVPVYIPDTSETTAQILVDVLVDGRRRQVVRSVSAANGTPSYAAGSGGATLTIPAGGALVGISAAIPPTGFDDGYVTLDGGDQIPIRAGGGALFLEPQGNWIGTEIFVSPQCDYYVEWVT